MSTSVDDTRWINSKSAFRFPVRAGDIKLQVSFYVDDETGFWHVGWVSPTGVPVVVTGPTLESCENSISPRIAALWEEWAAPHSEATR